MSLRCACLPWRSGGPLPCPSLSLPSYAAFPGPATRGSRSWTTLSPVSQLPSRAPSSALPGSTHSLCHHVYRQPFLPHQLALLHTPPLSDIFVFTDASPKDAFLTNRVESLSRERRCRVSTTLAARRREKTAVSCRVTPNL